MYLYSQKLSGSFNAKLFSSGKKAISAKPPFSEGQVSFHGGRNLNSNYFLPR